MSTCELKYRATLVAAIVMVMSGCATHNAQRADTPPNSPNIGETKKAQRMRAITQYAGKFLRGYGQWREDGTWHGQGTYISTGTTPRIEGSWIYYGDFDGNAFNGQGTLRKVPDPARESCKHLAFVIGECSCNDDATVGGEWVSDMLLDHNTVVFVDRSCNL